MVAEQVFRKKQMPVASVAQAGDALLSTAAAGATRPSAAIRGAIEPSAAAGLSATILALPISGAGQNIAFAGAAGPSTAILALPS